MENVFFATINSDYLLKNVSKRVPQRIYKNESLMHDRVILRKDSNYATRKKCYLLYNIYQLLIRKILLLMHAK
jgi:hypothetical protein